jgi:hypothetical protein
MAVTVSADADPVSDYASTVSADADPVSADADPVSDYDEGSPQIEP